MKKILFLLLSVSALYTASAQVKMPAPSPTQSLKQDFGMSSIEIKYSRPAMKGRKIFGDLVPYNKLWRTGANGATIIRFNDPVEIGGKKVDTGSYALYTIPNTDSWTIILNKGTGNWGVDGYKESEDVARFNALVEKVKPKVENFTIQVANIQPESCDLQLTWEKTKISIPVTVNIKDKVRAQIDAAMQTEKKPYWQAAQFYFEYDKNMNKALENVTKATEAQPTAFWIFLYKARIQKEMGDKAGARESSEKSKQLAKEAQNDDYVKLNEEFLKKL
ncbi:MAG TPA: DUF2911 domain-containing protein [Ferruginibacter sp.]|nr:DUF2911 domain-containing protein [Ferruginibacter sp.]